MRAGKSFKSFRAEDTPEINVDDGHSQFHFLYRQSILCSTVRSARKPRIFSLKTDRARAHLGAAWRILEKALRGASCWVRWVRALSFPASQAAQKQMNETT